MSLTPSERADLIRLLGKAGVPTFPGTSDNMIIYLCDAHGIDV